MSLNLLDLAKGYLTNAAVEKVSEFLGENPTTVQSGISAALPTILGSIMNTASTGDGLSSIMGLLKNNDQSNVLSNFSETLGNKNGMETMLSGGQGILSSLLGNNLGSVVSAISSFSGLKSSSSSSLLSMAAPLLMGVLGKQVSSQGLGLSGVANLLMGQKDFVKSAMPAGLSGVASLMNFDNLGDFKGGKVEKEIKEVVEETSGGFNWWPWLVGALLLIGAFWAFKNCKGDVKDAAANVQEATVAVVDSSASLATDAATTVGEGITALGDFFKRKLPNGIELNIPKNGIEDNLIMFVEDTKMEVSKDKWFNFDRINFATGSANLSEESKEQVKNIAEILKAFPAVNIKIGGYTDNTGNAAANLKLSDARAKAVMNAIVTEGVDKARLEAEGYGQEHPVATNDTEEGRAQNRRIAVRVTKK